MTLAFGPAIDPASTPPGSWLILGNSSCNPGPHFFDNFSVAPAAETPVGTDVVVQPIDTTTGTSPVTLTFSAVTQAGATSLTTSSSGPQPPAGFSLGDPATFYELTTTALFSPPITVCIDYSGVSFTDASQLQLFHFESGAWVDRTISRDTINSVICASVDSLSPFAVFERTLRAVSIDIKPGSFPNSINPKSEGKIPVAILSSADFNAPTQVNPSSLKFGRTGNEPSLAFCNTSPQDVNGDGLPDLVCHFNTSLTGFQAGDTKGVLTGQTVGGVGIIGTDSVKIVPK